MTLLIGKIVGTIFVGALLTLWLTVKGEPEIEDENDG